MMHGRDPKFQNSRIMANFSQGLCRWGNQRGNKLILWKTPFLLQNWSRERNPHTHEPAPIAPQRRL
jgi:hypothetical protein